MTDHEALLNDPTKQKGDLYRTALEQFRLWSKDELYAQQQIMLSDYTTKHEFYYREQQRSEIYLRALSQAIKEKDD